MFKSPTPMAPTQNFSEGVFIDYRYFQHANTADVYPFGHGLTYTRFDFRNLTVRAHKVEATSKTPAAGKMTTGPAQTYGTVNTSIAANEAPAGFQRIKPYVYPWIMRNTNGTTLPSSSPPLRPSMNDTRTNGSPQAVLPAGGAPGGNPGLYDTVYTIGFDVLNQGNVSGTAVPQMYVQLGGHDNPWGVLRGFDDVAVAAGKKVHVEMNLTRRDVSNWDVEQQNWVVTNITKYVFVGRSVVDIALNSSLPALGL